MGSKREEREGRMREVKEGRKLERVGNAVINKNDGVTASELRDVVSDPWKSVVSSRRVSRKMKLRFGDDITSHWHESVTRT